MPEQKLSRDEEGKMRRLPELYGIYHEPWQARLVRVQADLDTGEKVLQETEVQQVRAESHSSDRYCHSKATRNGKGIYYGPVNNPRITWRAETLGFWAWYLHLLRSFWQYFKQVMWH